MYRRIAFGNVRGSIHIREQEEYQWIAEINI